MDLHTIVGYYDISNKYNFQVAGFKVKVTVAIFRKKKLCHCSSPCIYQWILIYLHTLVGMIISQPEKKTEYLQYCTLMSRTYMTFTFKVTGFLFLHSHNHYMS